MSDEKTKFLKQKFSRREFLRKVALGGAGAVAASALAACVPATPQVIKETVVVKVKEKVTIEFANDWNSGMRFQMITDARNMFEDENPDIHVRMLHLGGGTTFAGGFADYIVPRFLTGTAPDLIYGAATFIYTHHDFLLDMTDGLAALGWNSNDYYDVYRATHDEQGRQYGTPFNIFMSGWLYNVTLFEEEGVEPPSPDWDWNELLAKARALTKPEKQQYGVWAFNHWEYGYFPLMYANGARFTNPEFTKTMFNTPDAAEALQWYIDLIYKEKVAPTPEIASSVLAALVGNVFASGKVAMAPYVLAFDGLNTMIGNRFKYGLHVPPKSPSTGQRGAYKGMEPIMVSKEVTRRGNEEAALKFAIFLTSDKYQSHISSPLNRVTACVNKKVVHGEIGNYLEPPPENMKVVGEILDSDYIYDHPMFARYGEFRQALWTPIDRAFLNEITAAAALAQAEKDCDQILQSAK